MADELIVPPGYPKISTLWDCIVETEAMIDATARAAAEHFRQRRSWRVRLHRRLRWWAVLLGLAPFAPAKSNYFPFTPDITPKQIRKLPFFEGLAIAMVITDLVIREELVIWLNKEAAARQEDLGRAGRLGRHPPRRFLGPARGRVVSAA